MTLSSQNAIGNVSQKFYELNNIIFGGSTSALSEIVNKWPNILGAIGILIVGYLFSSIIEKIILKIVKLVKFDLISEKLKFKEFLDKAHIESTPTEILVDFVQGYIYTVFIRSATKLLGLNDVSLFLDSVLAFLPKLAIALFVILLGFRFATNTSAFIENTLKMADASSARLLGGVTKYIIITFTVITALNIIELAKEFVNILFVGVVATLTLALGLSLGLGGAKFVASRLDKFDTSYENKGKSNN